MWHRRQLLKFLSRSPAGLNGPVSSESSIIRKNLIHANKRKNTIHLQTPGTFLRADPLKDVALHAAA
jgi:hypothetical protein